MPQSDGPKSLEEALKRKSISTWDFYSAVTGEDWWGASLKFGETHPFNFTRKNRDQIYELVNRLRKHYEQVYKPEDNPRQYYCYQFDRVDEAYKTRKIKDQKIAIQDLLSAIVMD